MIDIKYNTQLFNFLSKYKWEWFLTLNTEKMNIDQVELKLKRFRDYIRKVKGWDFGYMGVFNWISNPHIHLLVNISTEPTEQDIKDISKYWNDLSKRELIMKPIYYLNGLLEYISYQNLPNGHFDLVQPIGVKGFLKKYEIE